MATSSLTVSSAASRRQRMRSLVSSPAASRPASSAGKPSGALDRSLDINISLYLIGRRRKGLSGFARPSALKIQIQPNPGLIQQSPAKLKQGRSFDSLVRNEPYQRLTLTPR